MKKPYWSALYFSSGSTDKVRSLPLNKAVVWVFVLLVFLGTLGLGRCIYFVSSYGLAKLGMYYSLKENRQLKMKVYFFSKFAQEEGGRIDRLISFEDKTRIKFGMDQISNDLRKVGVGGRPSNTDMILASLEDPVISKADTIKENIFTLLRLVRLEDTTFSTMARLVDKQIDTWQQRPVVSPVWGRVTSSFGYRIHPITGYNMMHEGVDIANNPGTPVHSTADGIVFFVGYKDYYGNVVMIAHPASGFKTVFAHLKKSSVVEGQVVKRGDVLGELGNSGRSTGPHLHYEVRKLGTVVNPVDFILPTDIIID
jgi:hypothetical protein